MASSVHNPEVFRPGQRLPIRRDPVIETIAWLMDGMIPIGRWSIGLDGIIGLVPGLGDVIGALIGMIIVLRAVQAGIPRVAIARMMTNIAIDTLVGAIPVFGDAFDFVYKSNIKNMRIYEQAVAGGRGDTARHWGFFLALLGAAAAVIALLVLGAIAALRGFRLF